MIVYNLPAKSSKQFTGSTIDQTPFSGGIFPVNFKMPIVKTVAGSVYYLERFSFNTSLSDSDFIYSSKVDTIPFGGSQTFRGLKITIVDKNNLPVNSNINLVSHIDNAPLEIWFSSDNENELFAVVTGTIESNDRIVTESKIKCGLSVIGYEINSTQIAGAYRSGISDNSLNQFRGGM
jgi:hypothetical protein